MQKKGSKGARMYQGGGKKSENKDKQKQTMKYIFHSQLHTNGSATTASCTARYTYYTCTTQLQRIKTCQV